MRGRRKRHRRAPPERTRRRGPPARASSAYRELDRLEPGAPAVESDSPPAARDRVRHGLKATLRTAQASAVGRLLDGTSHLLDFPKVKAHERLPHATAFGCWAAHSSHSPVPLNSVVSTSPVSR